MSKKWNFCSIRGKIFQADPNVRYGRFRKFINLTNCRIGMQVAPYNSYQRVKFFVAKESIVERGQSQFNKLPYLVFSIKLLKYSKYCLQQIVQRKFESLFCFCYKKKVQRDSKVRSDFKNSYKSMKLSYQSAVNNIKLVKKWNFS